MFCLCVQISTSSPCPVSSSLFLQCVCVHFEEKRRQWQVPCDNNWSVRVLVRHLFSFPPPPPSFGCVASLFPFSNWNDSLLVSTKTQLRQHQFIVRRRKRTRTDERGNVLPVCVTRTTCNNILCLIISFQFVFSNCRLFYLSVQRGREKKKKMVE